MSTAYVELLKQSLARALAAPVDSVAAFEELALAGERLRAAAPDWLGEGDEATRRMLTHYDGALLASKAYAPTDLEERLDAALVRLDDVAGAVADDSDVEL